jgi:hypothetical protein
MLLINGHFLSALRADIRSELDMLYLSGRVFGVNIGQQPDLHRRSERLALAVLTRALQNGRIIDRNGGLLRFLLISRLIDVFDVIHSWLVKGWCGYENNLYIFV